ncbi:hypothetical protein EZV62_027279 [Acer yangbiense]|uniref:ATP-dependent RNA helicase n=1 Tax=Acer yangbiense TaxID=1000413 RepID=A0A5C7GTS9_9ROSI|nr:hypothetical protein EZV62_027279 [Acer yangbiense]
MEHSMEKEKERKIKMEEPSKKSVPILPWMRSPIDVSIYEDCPLETLPCLDSRLKVPLQSMGISLLFPVQVAVWQETVGPGSFERDVCINSPTGSGKTLAYALPIVQTLSKRAVRCLRALVVLPTRDLALQVKEVFAAIAPAVGLSVGLAVGQSSIADEIAELIKRPKLEAGICYDPEDISQELQSAVDILVATPGRLMDHINTTKGFTLEHLCYLIRPTINFNDLSTFSPGIVIHNARHYRTGPSYGPDDVFASVIVTHSNVEIVVDETDRLLREAYQAWLPTVLQLTRINHESHVPCVNTFLPSTFGSLKTIRRCGVERGFKDKPYPRLVKMVLSATLTQDPSKLAQLNLHHPLFLTTGESRYKLPEKLESYKLMCESKLKPLYLVALLKSLGGEKCIVFTSSVESTHRLCTLLNFFDDLKIKIKEYSGLQRQSVRSKTLKAFREGEIQVLVSSDAMTRGMDVEGVRNVINYDMPPYIKTYIHRAGRTARAGQTGRCFTLLRKVEVKRFKKQLQKADTNSCPVHTLPSKLIDSHHPLYLSALEKLKDTVESEASRKRKIGFKYSKMGKGK